MFVAIDIEPAGHTNIRWILGLFVWFWLEVRGEQLVASAFKPERCGKNKQFFVGNCSVLPSALLS